jgi:hypothetical protein
MTIEMTPVPMSISLARMVVMPFHVFLTVYGTVMAIAVIAISLRNKRGGQGRRQYHYSHAQDFVVHRNLLGLL